LSELITVNARIASTTLGIEDHGIMTFFVHLEWPGAGQGCGGFALDRPKNPNDYSAERVGHGPAIVAIRKILETVGVDNWEDLKGKLIRAKVDRLGSSRTPIIGNILEDRWFDLKEFMEQYRVPA
jgi:hypothetical protein